MCIYIMYVYIYTYYIYYIIYIYIIYIHMYVISAPGGRQDQLRLKTFDRLRSEVGPRGTYDPGRSISWEKTPGKIIQKNGDLRWIEWMIFLDFFHPNSSQFI